MELGLGKRNSYGDQMQEFGKCDRACGRVHKIVHEDVVAATMIIVSEEATAAALNLICHELWDAASIAFYKSIGEIDIGSTVFRVSELLLQINRCQSRRDLAQIGLDTRPPHRRLRNGFQLTACARIACL